MKWSWSCLLFLPFPSPERTTQFPPCRRDVQDRGSPQDTCPCPFAVLGIEGRPQSSLDLGLFGCPALKGTKSHSPKHGRRHRKSDIYTYAQECAHILSQAYTCVYTQTQRHIHTGMRTHTLTGIHTTHVYTLRGRDTCTHKHGYSHRHTHTC